MTNTKCKTLRELITALEEIADEHGERCEWHGWDDGSIVITEGGEDDEQLGCIDSAHYDR